LIADFATIDYETYYDRDFSLSKLTTDEYCMSSQFEVVGVSVKPSLSKEPIWFSGSFTDTQHFLQGVIDWPSTAVCAHNAHFDGFITTQLFNLKPKLWMDTVPLSRMAFPWLARHSLAKVAEHMGLGQKGTEVQTAMGLRRADFTEAGLARYAEYCCNDVALCSLIASKLLETTPALELYLIDMTTRMFTEPTLIGDANRLLNYHNSVLDDKDALLERAQIGRDELMSNPKFAEALRNLGVIPPMKMSARTGKETYAFAKNDRDLTDLLDHSNPDVQSLVAARLGVKSTINETRALRLMEAARRGPLPVHLNHWGAKTTGRLSGGNKMNWQNIPARGTGAEIRKCVGAPPGNSVVVGDSSNIELRVVMSLAGQTDVVDKIRSGVDLYCDFASEMYNRNIVKDDKKERMVGKVAMLSLQYGAGAARFKEMVRVMAGQVISEAEAERIVWLYRSRHDKVVALWKHCNDVILPAIQRRDVLQSVDVNGWFLTTHNGFSMPNSVGVVYHDLHRDATGDWQYWSAGKKQKIYGGKVVENISQHAARHIVMWQTARINRRFPVALSVHDEAVCVVTDARVDECKEWMQVCLREAPPWCRGSIPLDCEVEVGRTYGDAK